MGKVLTHMTMSLDGYIADPTTGSASCSSGTRPET